MSLTPRVTTMDRLRVVQFKEVAGTLRQFADAADRIEAALGKDAPDNRPVRSGARLTLADLRRARKALALMGTLMDDFHYRR